MALRVVGAHLGDLAHPHPGHPHVVAGAQPAGVGEHARHGVAALQQAQAADEERGDEDRAEHGQRHQADGVPVAVPEGSDAERLERHQRPTSSFRRSFSLWILVLRSGGGVCMP